MRIFNQSHQKATGDLYSKDAADMSGRDDKKPDLAPEDPKDNFQIDDLTDDIEQDYEGDEGDDDVFDHYLKKSSKRFHRNSNRSKDRWSDED